MDELSDRVVYVGNVAAEIDEPSLLAIFSNCGPVTEIRLAGQVSQFPNYVYPVCCQHASGGRKTGRSSTPNCWPAHDLSSIYTVSSMELWSYGAVLAALASLRSRNIIKHPVPASVIHTEGPFFAAENQATTLSSALWSMQTPGVSSLMN
jgi:hypothetical protein